MRATRHILTGEYPPMPGGVSDYTRMLARALALAGEGVTVWVPIECDGSVVEPGVEIRRLTDHFACRGRAFMDAAIPTGSRVLVQYVPHAFGARTMNLGFISWLYRHRRRWAIDVMFHEVAMPFGFRQPMIHNIPAAVQRAMAGMLVRAARRVFISTESWRPILGRAGQSAVVSPVFSNLPPADTAAVERVRREFSGQRLIGHFGGCGPWMIESLAGVIPRVLSQHQEAVFVFIGRGSSLGGAKVRERRSEFASRIIVTGELSAELASAHVAACDLMLLPYPDGITTRRSSAMASLAAGVPVVTTTGHLTETFWSKTSGVLIGRSPSDCADLAGAVLADGCYRKNLAAAALNLYARRFDIVHTVRRLREAESGQP